MIIYLTSHIGGSSKKDGIRIPTQLSAENGLLDSFQKHWKNNAKVLIMSSDPKDTEKNDLFRELFAAAFPMSGLSVSQMDLCDDRNTKLSDQLSDYDVVILAGGHVPTQNNFFKRIRLKERLTHFNGILIGISAGTMNCARTVYALPELEGESINENYERFLTGLGVTQLMVIPHYQEIKDDLLDGQRLIEDIAYSDSYGREFYALEDGSYFLIEGTTTTLFGTAYLIKDGNTKQICDRDKKLIL